jgi:hypothetical protein
MELFWNLALFEKKIVSLLVVVVADEAVDEEVQKPQILKQIFIEQLMMKKRILIQKRIIMKT